MKNSTAQQYLREIANKILVQNILLNEQAEDVILTMLEASEDYTIYLQNESLTYKVPTSGCKADKTTDTITLVDNQIALYDDDEEEQVHYLDETNISPIELLSFIVSDTKNS